jgi:hypothetical protein
MITKAESNFTKLSFRFAFSVLVLVTTPVIAADKHPDESKYEYLVKDFKGTYPSEAERIKWECWDDVAKASVSCTFVRGSLTKFRHVYREKDSDFVWDLNNPCDVLVLDFGKISYEQILQIMGRRGKITRENACEAASLLQIDLSLERQMLNIVKRGVAKQCDAWTARDVESHRDEVKFGERHIASYKRICARNQENVRRQREYEIEQAEREAKEYAAAKSKIDYGRVRSDGGYIGTIGAIECFGGCQSNFVSPRGPYSTITNRAWGDTAPDGDDSISGVPK